MWEPLETRALLATYWVTNTSDALADVVTGQGVAGSLRRAIQDSNADPGPDVIEFRIPAAIDPGLRIPVSGFDSLTQTWRIELESPLPPVSDQTIIDGYSQAHFPVQFRYPDQVSQEVLVSAGATGGTFTLTTQAPLPGLPTVTTAPIAYNATGAQVLAALNAVVGVGNVFLSGGDANVAPIVVKFIGAYLEQGLGVPDLTADGSGLMGGTVGVKEVWGEAVLISSSPSTKPALMGNDAVFRVIVDGSGINRAVDPNPVGFVLEASHSVLRGLTIDGFGVGVSVASGASEGIRIQGNSVGGHFAFHVDPATGAPLKGPGRIRFAGLGNENEGILLGSSNTTVGGVFPQDSNVITLNGAQGIRILPGAPGNQVIGNQIGVAGPVEGRFAVRGNRAEGILVESENNVIGGARSLPGNLQEQAGNLISGNGSHGIHLLGVDVSQTRIEGNYIGVAPGGGYLLGSGDPGNEGDGIRVAGAHDTWIGGPDDFQRNVISANDGVGVRLTYEDISARTGASARALLVNNYIGLTADGGEVLGNDFDGVLIETGANTVGAKNVISANLRGVRISGPDATGNVVEDSYIGTDMTGLADMGNSLEGIRVEFGASDVVVRGTEPGLMLVSGNDVGILVVDHVASKPTGAYYDPAYSATDPKTRAATGGVRITGTYVGADPAGTHAIGNSQQGIWLLDAANTTIGGTTGGAGNLLLSNRWGVVLEGADSVGNVLEGNVIERSALNGVLVLGGASDNSIGGLAAGAGNTIRRSTSAGVRVAEGVRNSILSNLINESGGLGIDLDPKGVNPNDPGDTDTGPNQLQNSPVVTAALVGANESVVQGRLSSHPDEEYLVQLFAGRVAAHSQVGPILRLLSTQLVRTDATGSADFSAVLSELLVPGEIVTATATSSPGDTSEFSATATVGQTWVQFQVAGLVVDEGAGTATVVVTRTGTTSSLVTVAYRTEDGTARAGMDYLPAQGVLTFLPGVLEQSFSVPIVPDSNVEVAETVRLLLESPELGASLGALSAATLTIRDDDSWSVRFSAAAYGVGESAGLATIGVLRDGNTGEGRVRFETSAGSAQPGRDYQAVSGLIQFVAGQSVGYFTVPIVPNTVRDGERSLRVELSDPEGLVLGTPREATINIQDDDFAGQFGFQAESYLVSEAGGSALIEVRRSGGSAGRVSVPYATVPGSATADVDYLSRSGVLVFEPGEVSQYVSVPIVNDASVEASEAFTVRLGTPSGGGGLATGGTISVTILDNDVDREGPRVTGIDPVLQGNQLLGFRIGFSEELSPARATDLLNYDQVVSAGRDGRFQTRDDVAVRWSSATYDAVTHSVVLLSQSPLALNMLQRVRLNRHVAPGGPGSGIADAAGNLLDGDGNGLPGGLFQGDVGVGTSLSFVDQDGDRASLKLSRGGMLRLWVGADGKAVQVTVTGAVPGGSKLSGSVRRVRGSNGQVVLPVISGLSGVASSLRPPAFSFGLASPAAVVAASGALERGVLSRTNRR